MAGFKEGALQLKERDLLLPSDVGTIKLLADTTGKLYTVNEFGVSARIGGGVSGNTYWNDILDKQYANNYTDGIISSATFIKINSKLDSVWKILKSNESLPITPEIGMIGINHRYALNSNIKTSGNGCDVAYWNVTTSGGITSGYWSFENKTFGSCIVNLDTNNIDSHISAVNTNWSESPANYPVGIYECISATNGTYYWNPVVINKYPTPDVSKNYFLVVDPSTSAYTWSNSISAIYASSATITNLSGTSIHYTSGSFDNVTIKSFGGTSAQFVKGDGSLDSTKYWTSAYHPTTLSAYDISTEDTLFDPIYLNNSVGVIDSNAPSFLDNNNGTCTIGSCNVNLRDNTTLYGRIKTYNVSSKTFTIPADGNTYFIEINYNSGNPTYQLTSNAADINDSTIVAIYSCWRVTTSIGCAYFGSNGTLLSNKINYMIDDTKPYSVSNGSSLRVSEVNRLWSITSATIYSGTTKVNVPSITASNTNMYACYHSSGSWIYTSGSSLYDNLNYDDGTNLQSLGNNKWAVRWIYRAIGNPDRIFYTLGSASYNTSASADIEQPRTDLPKVIIDHCILVGKSIIQYNAASGITRYVISTAFSSSSVTNHNDLNGILGDTPYYHLGLSGYNLINNIEALSGSSGLLKLTSGTPSLDTNSYAIASGTSAQFLKGDGSLDSSHYLTSNQNIILSGDVSGSGTSAINLSLSNIITSGTAGSDSIVPVITYDQKGRLTSVTSAAIQISESQVSNLTSDLNSKLNTVTAASTYLTISNPTFSGILSGPQLSATHISASSLYDSQLSNTNVLISSGGTIIDSQISNDVLMYLSGTSANIQNQFNRLTGDFSDVDDQFLPMWSSAVNGYVNSTAATVGADKGVIVATNTYANAANDEHGPGIGVEIVIPLSGGTNTARGFRFNTGLNNELRLWQGTWGNPISWVKTFEVTSGGELVLPLTMSGEKILVSNSNHGISETTIPSTYLNGLSANIQDQINNNSGIVNSALSNYLPLSGGYNNKLTGDLFTKSITMLSGCFYINNTGTDNNSAYIKYNSDSNFQINSDYSRSILFTFEGSTTPTFAIGSGSITANADITTKSIYPTLGTGCAIGSSTNQYADIFVTQIGSPSAYVTDAYLGNIHGNSISTYSISTSSVVISGGTSSQFLKADGSLDSNEYVKSFSVFPSLTISGPAYVKLAQLSTNPGGSLSEINLTIYSNNSMGSNIPTVTMVDFSTTSAEINVLARTLNTDYGKAKYGYVVNGNFVELWTKLDDPWWNEFKVEVNSNSNEFSNNVGTLAYQNTDPGITFVTNVVKYDDRYLQVNQPALSGTGLLKLTSGTPSIDSTSYWYAGNHPTVLYNYGITSSDATLDGRYLQLIGGILTGSLFGVNSYLNANENTHDTAPVLTLTNSIYTHGTTLLLAAGTGSTSEIGFSNIGKPEGNQRWNIGVYNDIFYIGGNPTNNTGNLNPYTFSRSGNLGVYGSVTAASFIGPLSGNAATATKLATARTIALSGDGSWSVSFDGSANVTSALTLATVNSNVGSFGSATTIPTFTVNAKGLTTAASNVAIFIPHTQISDWGTYINQALLTTSSPTFASITASNSFYGIVGADTADAQKWYLIATVKLTDQFQSASMTVRFNSNGGNGAMGIPYQYAGSCLIRAKQQSAMTNSLDNFTIGWNYCNGMDPSTAVIGVKTTDNSSNKIVNIYLRCPISYEGMSWQIDNMGGFATATGNGTTYVTTLPTGLATYYGNASIWSNNWTNAVLNGGLTATGLITANGGITGSLTGTASNASALGGVAADYFVQGSNSSRTTVLAGAVTSQSQLLKSGFYSGQQWTDAPVASTWTHLIHTQYGNDGGSANNWSFDIAANFGSAAYPGSPEAYYVRAIANGISTGWRTLIHSANYPSFNNFTSGVTTTALTVSGNSNITGTTDITGGLYLRQGAFALNSAGSGWVQWYDRNNGSPIITAAGGFVGNLTGTASNASALGGRSSNNYVWGNGLNYGVRTYQLSTYAGGTPQNGSINTLTSSTFADGNFTDTTQMPQTGWWTFIRVKHSDPSGTGNADTWGTDWAAAMTPGYGNNEQYCVRSNTKSSYGAWRTLIHSANYASFNNFTSGLITTTLTASGLITANGGIVGNGSIGSSSAPFDCGYFSTGGIDIGSGLLKFFSPSPSTALLGVGDHLMTLSLYDGSITFPSNAAVNGILVANGGISIGTVALSANTTFDAISHNGRIINLGVSYVFDLSRMSAGNCCIVAGTGYVNCGSGVSYYLRGSSVTGTQRIMGSAVVWYDGSKWFIG